MSRRVLFVTATAVVAIVAVTVATLSGKAPSAPAQDVTSHGTPAAEPAAAPRAGGAAPTSAAGAVAPRAPASSTASSTPVSPAVPRSPVDTIGVVQGVPIDLNPQVASVASALAQHDHPERLSAMVEPPAFDPQAYATDPQRYANEVVPGRVFQAATPGPAVPVLQPVVPTQVTIAQDQETILRVKSLPGSPITFTSFDLGRFGNQLVSQTVIADSAGIGSVSFTAGAGTVDAVHILAGSPSASGQVAFDVMVTPKG